MECLLISLASLLIGAFGMRLFIRRKKRFVPEDQNAGLRRYQAYKKLNG